MDPSISLLTIHPKEMKRYIHTKTCRSMFIAALFIRALETIQMFISWWKEKQNVYILKYNLILKRNKLLIQVTTWLNLKSMMVSEKSQIQKAPYWKTPFIWNIQKKNIYIDWKSAVSWAKVEVGISYRWPWGIFLRDKNVLRLTYGDGYTFYELTKNHWLILLKQVFLW